MLKRLIACLKSMFRRGAREFHDHTELRKFEQQRPRDALDLAALYGMMR
jgi:hypothetical protein